MVKLGLVFLICLLSLGITKPFIGHHDWNGVFYSNIARNYLRVGLFTSRLGQVTEFGIISQPQSFYTHYPPLLTLFMAGIYKIFGVGDWQARLVPLIFTLASLLVLVRLFNHLKFKPWAQFAGLAVGLTPMWRYFSRMPSQEALIIFFSLLSVSALLKNQKKLFYFSVIANGLSGWAGYFLYPWLFLLNKRRPWVVKAMAILTVVFLLHLLHVYWLTGSVAGGGLFEALKLRLNLSGTPGFSWWNYLILEKQRLAAFYTLTLLAVATVSTIWKRQRLTIALLGWGVSYPLIFSNVVFVHDYFNIFFIPYLAVASAYLFNRIKRFGWVLALVFWLLVFVERQPFYKALAITKAHQTAFEIGQKINREVPENEIAYLISDHIFIESQNLFISYYADREVIYVDEPESAPLEAEYVFNQHVRIK